MAIKLHELSPRESKITLKGKEYWLKPFSMRAQIWAHDHFKTEEADGLQVLSSRLTELDLKTVCEVVYYLLKDKTDFPTLDSFMDSGANYKDMIQYYYALNDAVGLSQPDIDETEKELNDLKK